MQPTVQLAIGAGGAVFLMAMLWLIARAKQNAGIVDVGWSAGVGLLAVFYAATADGDPARRLLVGAMAGLWSARLGGYLLVNRVLGKPEDRRYAAMRAAWGARADRNFLWFFQAQAVLAVLFSLPMWVIAQMPMRPTRAVDFLGIALWWIAVKCESLADRQLARFRADPANHGKVCRDGLWYYSRHPNYFFEFVHWWAYLLLGWGAPWWWINAIIPWLMLWFLLRVTGIKPTEASASRSRGEDYLEYQRTTSAFIPWPPRNRAR